MYIHTYIICVYTLYIHTRGLPALAAGRPRPQRHSLQTIADVYFKVEITLNVLLIDFNVEITMFQR